MFSPRVKRGVFWLEGLNALSTTWYFYFIFFHLEQRFAFDKQKNLLWAAALGAVFAVTAVFGGKAGQKFGYLRALSIGFATMAGALFAGTFVATPGLHLIVLLVAAAGMCFTWPNLEAAIAEGETPSSLQRKLGIYNLVWSGGQAVAYFTGGAMIEHLGGHSIFLVPAIVMIGQFALTRSLARQFQQYGKPAIQESPSSEPISTARERRRSPIAPATFMKMAWIANPFSYVAVNTTVPLIPFLAGRLHLTATAAGIVCSIWIFARTLAFGLLWKWDGWHYRYRFLAGAYLAMVAGFMGIVLAGSLATLIVAQLLFGLALGLIYYSSLYYSMDVGETKGEHGGLHEGTIGLGIFAGPAIAYGALHYFPHQADAGVRAVGVVMLIGFGLLNWLRWRRR